MRDLRDIWGFKDIKDWVVEAIADGRWGIPILGGTFLSSTIVYICGLIYSFNYAGNEHECLFMRLDLLVAIFSFIFLVFSCVEDIKDCANEAEYRRRLPHLEAVRRMDVTFNSIRPPRCIDDVNLKIEMSKILDRSKANRMVDPDDLRLFNEILAIYNGNYQKL